MRAARIRAWQVGLVALWSVLGAPACVTVRPVEPNAALQLGSNEGILILHISTNVPVSRLRFGFGGVIENLPEGEHVQLIVTSAGSYSWTQIELPGLGKPRFRVRRDDDWKFRVEAGRLNYAGMLVLERSWGRLVDNRDRSGTVLHSLQQSHPGLLERYPIVYTGPGHHVFFDHYRDALLQRHEAGP